MAVTLLLADDHQIVRQGLRALLSTVPDFRLVGEAADGLEAVRLAERLQPDVLILDLMLPGLPGLEVARQVGRRVPRTRIVFLSMHANEAYVVEALRAGATAYVLKESGAAELVQAIRAAVGRRRYLSPSISEQALNDYVRKTQKSGPDPLRTLTPREREVLHLTAEGRSCPEIAERLCIGARTVETHRENLMRKLGVRNQKELVRFAAQHGLIPPES